MIKKINLKEIEKKAYTSFFEDGLYEIFMAHLLLVGMLSSTLSETGVSDIIRICIYIPVMMLGVLIIYLGKKHITIPRLGVVNFRSERKKNISKSRMSIFAFVIVSVSIAVAVMTGNLNKSIPMTFIVPTLMFSFFAFVAYYHDYPRFLITGLFFASSELIYLIAENNNILLGRGLLAYGVPGCIILIIGIRSLYIFLKKYPKPGMEV